MTLKEVIIRNSEAVIGKTYEETLAYFTEIAKAMNIVNPEREVKRIIGYTAPKTRYVYTTT